MKIKAIIIQDGYIITNNINFNHVKKEKKISLL